MKVTLAILLLTVSNADGQLFQTCLNKPGAYCDYSCQNGYSQDPTSMCGLVTNRVCCVPNTTPPPSLTTITPPLNQCGVSKYGTEAGKPPVDSNNRIVNGQDAYANEFPWIVSMQFDSEHACGGSIISKSWILTAAHCFIGVNTNSAFSLSKIKIVAGEHRLLNSDGSEVYSKLAKVIVHPNYNRFTQANDIALVKLDKALEFDSNVREICLPDSDTGDLPRSVVVVAGWGLIEEDDFVIPNTLQKVQLVTIENAQCNAELSQYGKIDDGMICAEGKETDSCQGDSGGPLIMRASPTSQQMVQVGVVSWGIGCASGLPGVYTRVSYFTEWIGETVASN